MRELKFRQRKAVHYSLLLCVIFLQIIMVIVWYLEAENETRIFKAFDSISSSRKIARFVNQLNNSFINSQGQFNSYINCKNEVSLKNYFVSLNEMNSMVDSLKLSTDNSKLFKRILATENKTETDISVLKYIIHSMLQKRVTPAGPSDVPNLFKFKKFKVESILDDIKISSNTKKDSVPRKGLFSRLSNAIIGKQDIQKEWSNIIITIKYKDKITSGSIEKQLAEAFEMTNDYYENEFLKLNKSFLTLRNKDLELVQLNGELLNLSKNVLLNYNNSVSILQANRQKNLQDQYKLNKITKNYTIVILAILMLVISLILLNFTRMAFEYERRLTTAQIKIKQSLNFKNRIMGMISHEIRSPLNIISIYSKLISSSIKDIEIKKNFRSIEFTTNSLLLLSNQILEYSKNEEHKFEVKNKNFELKTEISQIISSISSLVQSKGNEIKIKSNLNFDCEVYSDVAKIHQLFYNIIGNANKFTDNGLILIDINVELISEFEITLNVEVQDNGFGISENDLKYIFESYYQGAVSKKVYDLGVGLGLNLCKEIVELFNGSITVQSEETKGTKVMFNLILSRI
jgi:two-component system sensor histidine kinase BarA